MLSRLKSGFPVYVSNLFDRQVILKKKKLIKNKGFKVKEFIFMKRLMCLKGPTALLWLNGITHYGDSWELLVRKLGRGQNNVLLKHGVK